MNPINPEQALEEAFKISPIAGILMFIILVLIVAVGYLYRDRNKDGVVILEMVKDFTGVLHTVQENLKDSKDNLNEVKDLKNAVHNLKEKIENNSCKYLK